jgi:hypothetical protein
VSTGVLNLTPASLTGTGANNLLVETLLPTGYYILRDNFPGLGQI